MMSNECIYTVAQMLLQKKQNIVKVLIFLSLYQKKFQTFNHVSAKGLAPPLSLWHGKDPITNQTLIHAVNTIVHPQPLAISSHSKCSACVSTARSHACVHVHPCTRKGQLSCPTAAPVRPAALACQGARDADARRQTRRAAARSSRARITARRTSASPPRARYKTPPRTNHMLALRRAGSLPPPIHLAYVRSPGRVQRPLEEEVTLLPEALSYSPR